MDIHVLPLLFLESQECSDFQTPEGAEILRVDDVTVVLKCLEGSHVSMLQCVDGDWQGDVIECVDSHEDGEHLI